MYGRAFDLQVVVVQFGMVFVVLGVSILFLISWVLMNILVWVLLVIDIVMLSIGLVQLLMV